MTDEAAFLAAITAAPEDDLPRLIYADWLEERGETARATFIRVQVERAALSPDDPRQAALRRIERSLESFNRDYWLEPVADLVEKIILHRGLPEEVTIDTARLPALESFLESRLPTVRTLRPTALMRNWSIFADSPILDRIDGLNLNHQYLRDSGAGLLATTPRLRQLRRLDLSGNGLGNEGARFIAQSFPYLEVLLLRENAIGPEGMNSLGAQAMPRLKQLSISCGFASEPNTLSALLHAPTLWSAATQIELHLYQADPRMVVRLTESPTMAAYSALDLRHTSLSKQIISSLLNSPHTKRLRELNLSFGDHGGWRDAWVNASGLQALRSLNLSHTEPGRIGLNGLVRSPIFAGLRHLDLSLNNLDESAIEPLLRPEVPTNLITLDLIYNQIGLDGRARLIQRFGSDTCLFDR